MSFESTDPEIFKSELSLLIVTATEVEREEVLKQLEPLPSQKEIVTVYDHHQTYYLGLFGVYGVVVVQSEMGAIGANASLVTTMNAINLWNPKAIIMVGIAFGVDDEKQNIGDVLISSYIIPYEFSKVYVDQTSFRSPMPNANTLLLNRARSIRNWDLKIEGRPVKVYSGPILTGEKLIDNKKFRDDLVKVYRNTIGGEMESAGVFAAANNSDTPWLIIKSICDFADGNKGKNKELNQEIAIKTSVSFTHHYLSNGQAFNELQFKPLIPSRGEARTSETVLLSSLISFLDNYNSDLDKSAAEQLRVAAREVTQTEIDTKLQQDTRVVIQLIPSDTLEIFERRILNCKNMYNEVLDSLGGFLPREIDDATNAFMKCICRELNRIIAINGILPPDPIFEGWWKQYKCTTGL